MCDILLQKPYETSIDGYTYLGMFGKWWLPSLQLYRLHAFPFNPKPVPVWEPDYKFPNDRTGSTWPRRFMYGKSKATLSRGQSLEPVSFWGKFLEWQLTYLEKRFSETLSTTHIENYLETDFSEIYSIMFYWSIISTRNLVHILKIMYFWNTFHCSEHSEYSENHSLKVTEWTLV